ncbi:MAG TPA: hypothetical protein VMM84_05955 [Pyrinomonadaceae bacterium]|nr:hypothetical protein [Pyrinomonadaceae bacterium]
MTTDADRARSIADRIARRVLTPSRQVRTGADEDLSGELAAVRASLSELQKRLVQIEARVRMDAGSQTSSPPHAASASEKPIPLTYSPWLAGVNAGFAHPSQERFGVEEAAVSELVDFFEKEKSCSIEPGGKPCDHCSMCSSRGF